MKWFRQFWNVISLMTILMRVGMSDKPDDLAWWNGQPINAMTREVLQAALIEANLIIERQKGVLAASDRLINRLKDDVHNLKNQNDILIMAEW